MRPLFHTPCFSQIFFIVADCFAVAAISFGSSLASPLFHVLLWERFPIVLMAHSRLWNLFLRQLSTSNSTPQASQIRLSFLIPPLDSLILFFISCDMPFSFFQFRWQSLLGQNLVLSYLLGLTKNSLPQYLQFFGLLVDGLPMILHYTLFRALGQQNLGNCK